MCIFSVITAKILSKWWEGRRDGATRLDSDFKKFYKSGAGADQVPRLTDKQDWILRNVYPWYKPHIFHKTKKREQAGVSFIH